jgi:hypothetical protein
MSRVESLRNDIGFFLEEVAKTFRSAQFYPLSHPVVFRGIRRVEEQINRILVRVNPLHITVQRDGFLYEQAKIPGRSDYFHFLAGELIRRFVKEIHWESPVGEGDLRGFFHLLLETPQEVQKIGGPEKLLAQKGARKIWVNAIRFEVEFLQEEEVEEEEVKKEEEEKEVEEEIPEVERFFRELMEVGDFPSFLGVLETAVRTGKQWIAQGNYPGVVSLVTMFCRVLEKKGGSSEISHALGEGIRALTPPPVLDACIVSLEKISEGKVKDFFTLFSILGAPSVPFLLKHLVETPSRRGRLRLLRMVRHIGKPALRYIVKLLPDARWYVVRNALILIGDLGDESFLPLLEPFLHHDRPQIRKSAITALRKAGGSSAIPLLLSLLKKGNEEDQTFILEELSYLPVEDVSPHLLQLIEEGDTVGENALRILAEMDPPGLLPYLQKILKIRPRWFTSLRKKRLRRVSAELLFSRLPESWEILKEYKNDPDPEVRRWVVESVQWLRKRKKDVPSFVSADHRSNDGSHKGGSSLSS